MLLVKNMYKKIIFIFTLLSLALPTFAVNFSVPLIGTTTTGSVGVFPNTVNGITPIIYAPAYYATSTAATSTFLGGVVIGGNNFFNVQNSGKASIVGKAIEPFEVGLVQN